MGLDNYKDKQHTTFSKVGSIYHCPPKQKPKQKNHKKDKELQSETLYDNKFLKLKKSPQGFLYSERRNIFSTAALAFRKTENNKYEFLVRFQPLALFDTPFLKDWKQTFPCPITGSMEPGKTPLDVVINEFVEEANIKGVSETNVVAFCFNVASTQSNEVVFNYLIDVSNLKYEVQNNSDGSVWEQVSTNKWISEEQLIEFLNNKDNQISLSSLTTCYNLFLQKIKKEG